MKIRTRKRKTAEQIAQEDAQLHKLIQQDAHLPKFFIKVALRNDKDVQLVKGPVQWDEDRAHLTFVVQAETQETAEERLSNVLSTIYTNRPATEDEVSEFTELKMRGVDDRKFREYYFTGPPLVTMKQIKRWDAEETAGRQEEARR